MVEILEILPWRGEVRGKSQRITGPKRDRSVTKMKIRFVGDLIKICQRFVGDLIKRPVRDKENVLKK